MGAGSGYWARLLQLRGVDIIAYDLHVAGEEKEIKKDDDKGVDEASDEEDNEDDEAGAAFDGEDHEEEEEEEEIMVEQVYWTNVLKGTPKDLHKHTDRALFLCYPDDFEDSHESMAMASLCNYAGDTVIHVGEMFGQTICLPGVWGRTSSKSFQIHLSTVYHKVLQVPLPSWHSSIDTLTIWKRTKSSITDGLMYAFIPENERIDLAAASPSIRHLLLLGNNDEDVVTTKSMKRKRNSKARHVACVEKNGVCDNGSNAKRKQKKGKQESSRCISSTLNNP